MYDLVYEEDQSEIYNILLNPAEVVNDQTGVTEGKKNVLFHRIWSLILIYLYFSKQSILCVPPKKRSDGLQNRSFL